VAERSNFDCEYRYANRIRMFGFTIFARVRFSVTLQRVRGGTAFGWRASVAQSVNISIIEQTGILSIILPPRNGHRARGT